MSRVTSEAVSVLLLVVMMTFFNYTSTDNKKYFPLRWAHTARRRRASRERIADNLTVRISFSVWYK